MTRETGGSWCQQRVGTLGGSLGVPGQLLGSSCVWCEGSRCAPQSPSRFGTPLTLNHSLDESVLASEKQEC